MEDILRLLKNIRDKCVTFINKNLDMYGNFQYNKNLLPPLIPYGYYIE